MTIWLGPDEVAKRLGVTRRTAMALMTQMPHSVISGRERKRIRVSEKDLDGWMVKRSTGATVSTVTGKLGSNKRLARR